VNLRVGYLHETPLKTKLNRQDAKAAKKIKIGAAETTNATCFAA
jgi:hypothetical protein